MDSRPEWERTTTGDGAVATGGPTPTASQSGAGDDVVVLPETTVLRSGARAVNWGAPDPAQRIDLVPQQRPAPPRPTLRYRFFTAVMILSFSVMVLAIVAAAADWGARVYEMDALLDEIEASEAIMLEAKADVSAIIDDNPGAVGGDDPAAGEELQRLAAEADSALAESAERIAAVPLLPWHDGVAAARSAYLSHSSAWQQYLSAAAGDSAQWFELYPQIDLTWELLAPHLRSAVPSPSIWGLEGRVDAILGTSDPAPEPIPLDV